MTEADEARGDVIEHSIPGAATVGKPQWLRNRLEWFQDLKLGLILHWGPYCQWDCCESWPLVPEDTWARGEGLECWVERGRDMERFQRDYWDLSRTFDPTEFDPEVWADIAKAAGMKYVVFTTKHHDGFCMWDTATTDYRVTHPDCPFSAHPRANILREVLDAFRSRGLRIGCYFSKSDWHAPCYWSRDLPFVDRNPNYDTRADPDLWARFVGYVHAQIRELMSGYGPVDILWLDGGQVRPPRQDIDMSALAAMARELQPGLIIADRTVGGVYEDFLTPEHVIPDEPLPVPWESCLTLGSGWKHSPGKMTYRPTARVLRELVEIVSKGGNLLLGVGPTAAGTFDEGTTRGLLEIGEWMAVNGEAVYGTRPIAPYREGDVYFASKGDYIYAIAFVGDEREVRLRSLRPAPGASVALLGRTERLAWRTEGDSALIELPAELPSKHAVTVTFPRGNGLQPIAK